MVDNAAAVPGEPQPLQLTYFDDHKESFSASIVKELKESSFFRPRLNKDGSVTDRDMLLLASAVIASSDKHIRATDKRNDQLESRLSWWNSPMFQTAAPPLALAAAPTVDDEATQAASSWFVRHLTLRNLASVIVVVVSGVWVFFTWYTSDKNEQLTHVKSLLESSERRAADTEKSKEQLEKDFNFYKDNAKDISKENETLKASVAAQKAKAEEASKAAAAQRTENTKLLDLLKGLQQRIPASGPKT